MLRFGELAGNDFRLVIFETQTMQERNQSRAAFIDAAKFLLDKSADLARRARRLCCEPSLQDVILRGARKAHTAAHVETDQTLGPARFEEVAPACIRSKVLASDHAAPPPVTAPFTANRADQRGYGNCAELGTLRDAAMILMPCHAMPCIMPDTLAVNPVLLTDFGAAKSAKKKLSV